MEKNLTVNIKPTGFSSPFSYEGETYTIEGKFRANQDKKLISIDGTVTLNESFKCNFSGENMPGPEADGLRYSVNSLPSLSEGKAIIEDIEAAVAAVNDKLNESE